MIFGMDYLGGAKFGRQIKESHPNGWAAGFFANTFGNAWPVMRSLLSSGKCPMIRIHALWTNHTYIESRDMPLITKELEKAVKLKKDFPNKEIQFSPICEHSIKGERLKKLLKFCRDNGPGLTIVNSVYQGDVVPGYLTEVHGSKPAPSGAYNFSFDGTSCVDSDVDGFIAKHKKAKAFFFWHAAFNGKLNPADTTPIPARKAWPTNDLIKSIEILAGGSKIPRGPGGKYKSPLPKGYLWKSHADRHETPPEPRAYKPVLICPVKTKEFQLVNSKGELLAKLPYYGTFTGGGYRYYAALFGYKIAGVPVFLRYGSKIVGQVNPGFRAGTFRE